MKPLNKIYPARFFARRNNLKWRVPWITQAVINVLNPKSLLDVGCANGELIEGFRKRGIPSWGIEGSEEVREYLICSCQHVLFHDLRLEIGIHLPPGMPHLFDLVISFEVAEHIEPEFADQYVMTLMEFSDRILISAAPPGQGGHYHVNCQPKEYWEEKFHIYQRDKCVENEIQGYLNLVKDKKEMRAIYSNLMYFHK